MKIYLFILILCFSCASEQEKLNLKKEKQNFEIRMKVDLTSTRCIEGFNSTQISCDGLTLNMSPIKYVCETGYGCNLHFDNSNL